MNTLYVILALHGMGIVFCINNQSSTTMLQCNISNHGREKFNHTIINIPRNCIRISLIFRMMIPVIFQYKLLIKAVHGSVIQEGSKLHFSFIRWQYKPSNYKITYIHQHPITLIVFLIPNPVPLNLPRFYHIYIVKKHKIFLKTNLLKVLILLNFG